MVGWGKEMVIPGSDYQEAVERLRQVANALEDMQESVIPTRWLSMLRTSSRRAWT